MSPEQVFDRFRSELTMVTGVREPIIEIKLDSIAYRQLFNYFEHGWLFKKEESPTLKYKNILITKE